MDLTLVDPQAGTLIAKALVATQHLDGHLGTVAAQLESGNLREAHKAACRAAIVAHVIAELAPMLEERIAASTGTPVCA